MDIVGDRSLRDLLEERAARYPNKVFLVFEDKAGEVVEYTYAEFLGAVRQAANGFASLGILKNDAVILHLNNCPEFLICLFGLAWIGAITVPSNTANTVPEMSYVLEKSGAVAAITSLEFVSVIEAVRHYSPVFKHVCLARSMNPQPNTHLLADLMNEGGEAPMRPLVSEDIVEMVFTSGTTSRPKGVLLTHANLLRSGERASRSVAMQNDERCLTALPAFHVNAQSMTIMASLTVGGTCVLIEEYRASKFWKQIRDHRATCTSLVAMQARTLLAQPPSEDDAKHSLRRTFYAINVTDREKSQFERRFNVELLNGYGLSEAMTIVTVSPMYAERRWPSIGLPAIDRAVRIVDESGSEVPRGTAGEITVWGIPGRTLMKEYFKDPEATSAAIRDGWLYTGDNGYMDEQGYVYFVDRKKDIIKRAGENISATEVEFAILEHPGVAEVAVIGVPDAIRDEAVKAYVVPAEGSGLTVEDVLMHCRMHLASFKIPTIVDIRTSLPRTSIGKVEKKLLRAESAGQGEGGKQE